MAFVPTRTDETKHSSVDGKFPAFNTAVEVSKGGFGVKRADGTFEILDALPLGRARIQLAVERGSQKTVAVTDSDAGFTAINFATANYITAAEVGANAKDGLDSDLLTSDLT
jgi:hypothetical protein